MDVQLAAVRLDARAEGLLVERPEVLGDGAHGGCDGGRPENSSPAPAPSRGALPRARVLPCAELYNTTLRCVGARTPSWSSDARPTGRPAAAAVLTRRPGGGVAGVVAALGEARRGARARRPGRCRGGRPGVRDQGAGPCGE